jgi:hypothetical protein
LTIPGAASQNCYFEAPFEPEPEPVLLAAAAMAGTEPAVIAVIVMIRLMRCML